MTAKTELLAFYNREADYLSRALRLMMTTEALLVNRSAVLPWSILKKVLMAINTGGALLQPGCPADLGLIKVVTILALHRQIGTSMKEVKIFFEILLVNAPLNSLESYFYLLSIRNNCKFVQAWLQW